MTWLYRLVQRPLSRAARWYQGPVEVQGSPPEEGDGVVLAMNHPCSVMDALLASSLTRETLRYLVARHLYERPLVAAILRAGGAIPAAKGPEGLELATGLMVTGAHIAIFPEGKRSRHARRVHECHTGAARLALSAWAAGLESAAIVPVGLCYLDRARPGTGVVVRVGAPMYARTFVGHDAPVRAMTRALGAELRLLAGHTRDAEARALLDDVTPVLQDLHAREPAAIDRHLRLMTAHQELHPEIRHLHDAYKRAATGQWRYDGLIITAGALAMSFWWGILGVIALDQRREGRAWMRSWRAVVPGALLALPWSVVVLLGAYVWGAPWPWLLLWSLSAALGLWYWAPRRDRWRSPRGDAVTQAAQEDLMDALRRAHQSGSLREDRR